MEKEYADMLHDSVRDYPLDTSDDDIYWEQVDKATTHALQMAVNDAIEETGDEFTPDELHTLISRLQHMEAGYTYLVENITDYYDTPDEIRHDRWDAYEDEMNAILH